MKIRIKYTLHKRISTFGPRITKAPRCQIQWEVKQHAQPNATICQAM